MMSDSAQTTQLTNSQSTNTETTSVATTKDTKQDPPTPTTTKCNMCHTVAPAQFHMVMSDNTLRNFCTYPCAAKYKNTYGFQVSLGGGPPPANVSLQVPLPGMCEDFLVFLEKLFLKSRK